MSEPEILPAAGLPTSVVQDFLRRCGGPRPMRQRGDPPHAGPGLVARAGGEIVGLATAAPLPSLRAGESLVLLNAALAPSQPAPALAARLVAGTLAALPPSDGRQRAVLSTPAGQEALAEALPALGFREIAPLLRYEAEVGSPPPPRPDPRFTLRFYGGGEAALDAAAAALYNRAFARDPRAPALTPEALRGYLEEPRYGLALLFEGEQLVAEATLWNDEEELYVGAILVARSHWASGASDRLMDALLRHAAAQGLRRLSGQIATGNRANRALAERSIPGARQVAETWRFERLR